MSRLPGKPRVPNAIWLAAIVGSFILALVVTALLLRLMGVPLVGGGRPHGAVWFAIPLVLGASYAASIFTAVRIYRWFATRAQNRSRPSTWRLSPYEPATGPARLPQVWVDRWERTLQSCAAHGGTVWPLQVAAPATEEQISEIERRLGHAIPASLRSFFATHAAAVSMAWELPGDTTAPAAEGIVSGSLEIRLDALPALAERYREWIDVAFSDLDLPYNRVWRNKLAFQEGGNDDMLALDLESQAAVYLSVHDGEGHGFQLGRDFADFMERWSALGCVGPEEEQWRMEFTQPGMPFLQPESERALAWRAWMSLG